MFVGLSRYPFDGGAPETISTGTTTGSPIGLALDGTTLYWGSTRGPVLRGAPGTPAVRLTYSVQANDVAVDDTYVSWGDNIGAIRRIPK